MSRLHYLTQYSQGGIYTLFQVEELAEKMGAVMTVNTDHNGVQRITFGNQFVGFCFGSKLNQLDAPYFSLDSIKQYQALAIGASVLLCCNGIDSIWRQGDIAVISRNEGANGIWATFNDGSEWNIGYHRDNEPDFIVIGQY